MSQSNKGDKAEMSDSDDDDDIVVIINSNSNNSNETNQTVSNSSCAKCTTNLVFILNNICPKINLNVEKNINNRWYALKYHVISLLYFFVFVPSEM